MRLVEYFILGIVCLFLLAGCVNTPTNSIIEDMVKDIQAHVELRSKIKEESEYYSERRLEAIEAKKLREEEMIKNRKEATARKQENVSVD